MLDQLRLWRRAPMTNSQKSRAYASLFSTALLVAPIEPCLADDVIITAQQAREYVNDYIGLAAMYAGISSECSHVQAGRPDRRYRSMVWEGDRDVYDMAERARAYRAVSFEMTAKLVAARPSEQADIDATFARMGGEAGLTEKMRTSVVETETDFQKRGLGETEACASLKSVVMNTAAQIGEPPDKFRIVP